MRRHSERGHAYLPTLPQLLGLCIPTLSTLALTCPLHPASRSSAAGQWAVSPRVWAGDGISPPRKMISTIRGEARAARAMDGVLKVHACCCWQSIPGKEGKSLGASYSCGQRGFGGRGGGQAQSSTGQRWRAEEGRQHRGESTLAIVLNHSATRSSQ